jgi:hypothetical protein
MRYVHNSSFSKKNTSLKKEQGAWWQVDLGEEKNINQILIYNRTDCCKDRLSNYRVSIFLLQKKYIIKKRVKITLAALF